ncbi:VOC family protein [Luteolibacter sp. Populi]|uniref:VOC family protein n=1 Tax=Luteolibacter sp. Populi TaxID=3230487 RepID=UPI003467D3CA
MKKSKLLEMNNMGIVVNDLPAAIVFFEELGLELEGEATVEGPWVDRLIALDDVRCDIAMMRTPDGHSRLEISKFQNPTATSIELNAPVNRLGYLRIMFGVEDLKEVLPRLQARGAELVGEVVQYEDIYLLCYVRGPEGIIIGLAESLR